MTPHDGTTFPRTFAVLRGDRDAFLFDANYLRHAWAAGGGGPDEIEICPHESNTRYMAGFVGPARDIRFRVQGRVRAFIVDGNDRQDYHDPWRYINHYTPHRRSEMMTWRFTGAAVHLMTSPTPIPVLDVDVDLPCRDNNHVRLVPARRRDADIWWSHWDPERLIDRLNRGAADTDSEDEREVRRRRRREARQASGSGTTGGGAAGGAAAAAPVTPPPPPPPPPIPKFVADALIRDAISRAAACPITMEPLVAETTAVTACFHLFERDAIAAWLAQSGNCCAVCKQQTTVTV